MSQCFQSFILFGIWYIVSSCIICLFLYSSIIKKKTMILLFQIFVSRQLSSIVLEKLRECLGKFWRSGITCKTSVFLSAPTGQQTGKLEYWKLKSSTNWAKHQTIVEIWKKNKILVYILHQKILSSSSMCWHNADRCLLVEGWKVFRYWRGEINRPRKKRAKD